jgi:hypothetical protein
MKKPAFPKETTVKQYDHQCICGKSNWRVKLMGTTESKYCRKCYEMIAARFLSKADYDKATQPQLL